MKKVGEGKTNAECGMQNAEFDGKTSILRAVQRL